VFDENGLDDIKTITIGTDVFDVSNGLESLVGVSVDTGFGQLTITGYENGVYDFEYVLEQNVDNDSQAGATNTDYLEAVGVSVSDGTASASAKIDVTIVDDAPIAALQQDGAQIVLSEYDIASSSAVGQILLDAMKNGSLPGADRPPSYTFGLQLDQNGANSGLFTTKGDAIRLYQQPDGSIVGRTAAGSAVFTVQMNPATGVLTISMLATLHHPLTTDVLHFDQNVLFATVTITDEDADVSTARVDLSPLTGFADSVPTITAIENAVIDNEANLSVAGTVFANAPDGVVDYDLAPSLAMAPEGLHYTIDRWGTLIATDQMGERVFTLSVDDDGKYTFTLLKPSPEAEASSPDFNSVIVDPGNPMQSLQTDLYASYDPVTHEGIGEPITSVVFSAGTGHLLNPSRDGLGVDNNLIDAPKRGLAEVLTMSFADDLTGAAIKVGNLKDVDVLVWRVYKDGALVDSGEIVGSYVDESGHVVQIANSESPVYWIDLSHNGLNSDAVFDTLEISAKSDSSYKFLGFTVEKPLTVDDLTLQFGVNAVDGDGDTSATGNFTVTVDGTDHIQEDVPGDTVLAGGTDVDVFKWTLAEPGSHDTVTDFDMRAPSSGGDVLDLRDLLQGENATGDNLGNYLRFEASGGGTVVKVSPGGEFNGIVQHDEQVAYQTIELHNVDLTSIGNDHQIIEHLINHGKLITD